MGRRRLPHNAHLPPGVRFRRGRYFLTFREDGQRHEILAGKTIEDVERARVTKGHLIGRRSDMPPKYAYDLHRRCRAVAARRGLPFDLEAADVVAMIEKANGRCPLTMIAFDYTRRPGTRFRPWAPSIDRIRPAAGYVRGNCRVVCAYINLAINEFGEDVFLMVARQVLRVRGGRQITVTNPQLQIGTVSTLAVAIGET